MKFLESAPSLPTSFPTDLSLGDVTAAASAIQFDAIGDTFDQLTPDFDEVSDLASTVVRSGGRIGVRTLRLTGRTVRKHPKGAASVLAIIVGIVAVSLMLKKRNETADALTEG